MKRIVPLQLQRLNAALFDKRALITALLFSKNYIKSELKTYEKQMGD
ncbi:hypothetical protein [Methanoculleus frigidifontis]|nr:hypothetical protein [Methanoculleus sp. FWC-SCC1]